MHINILINPYVAHPKICCPCQTKKLKGKERKEKEKKNKRYVDTVGTDMYTIKIVTCTAQGL